MLVLNAWLAIAVSFCASVDGIKAEADLEEALPDANNADTDTDTNIQEQGSQDDGQMQNVDSGNEQENDKKADGENLLGHLANIMDLGGEGLRHIKEHLDQALPKTEQYSQDIEAIQKGDDTKGIFYFFQLHDFDKNSKLDGLELYHALTDFHEKGDSENAGRNEGKGKVLSEEQAASIIDDLLLKHDQDGNGSVDYMELMNFNPDSLWNKLGSNVRGDEGDNQDETGNKG